MVYLSFLEVEYQSDLLAIYTFLGDCATDPRFSSRIVGVCRKPTPPTKIHELACFALTSFANQGRKKKGDPRANVENISHLVSITDLSARVNVSLAE
jgi:hypothetical protein